MNKDFINGVTAGGMAASLCLGGIFSFGFLRDSPSPEMSWPQFQEKEIFLNNVELKGILLEAEQKKRIGWILGKERKYLVLGELYDADGQNLTAANAWRLTPTAVNAQKISKSVPVEKEKSPSVNTTADSEHFSTEEVFALASKLAGFDHFNEQRANIIYGFFDPDCPQCEKSMTEVDELENEFKAAGANVRWLPVTILSLDRTKAGRAVVSGRKGLKDPSPQPSSETLDKVDMNSAALAYAMERPAVPYFVWQSKEEANAYIGAPSRTHWKMILSSFGEESETTSLKN